MKRVTNILIPLTIIILFLLILLLVHTIWRGSYLNNNQSAAFNANKNISYSYADMGEDAPIPSELHPVVERSKNILLARAADKNIDIVITDEVRSMEEQNELYAQGRTTPGNIVTNARGSESYHNYGLAIDYALREDNGEITWDTQYDGNNNGESDWLEVAELAKDLGFEWSGDWGRTTYYTHLQMDFGLSIDQLQAGIRPVSDENTEEALE